MLLLSYGGSSAAHTGKEWYQLQPAELTLRIKKKTAVIEPDTKLSIVHEQITPRDAQKRKEPCSAVNVHVDGSRASHHAMAVVPLVWGDAYSEGRHYINMYSLQVYSVCLLR